MNESLLFTLSKKVYLKIFGDSYIGDSQYKNINIFSVQNTNDLLSELLEKEHPLMVSRFGNSELNCVNVYLSKKECRKMSSLHKYIYLLGGDVIEYTPSIRKDICENAGFFPNEISALDKFSECYIEATKNIDVLAAWKFLRKESYIQSIYCPSATFVEPRGLEPYYCTNPWTTKLKNKKVLVIHPFTKTIESQYASNREKIFPNSDILPEFELKTVQAVQTIAGNQSTNFKDWFEALSYMESNIQRYDFDIALIGAGAYGLPLASFVKKMGKKAIHLGGATQILFGIRGKRWDDHPVISNLYNEHWVRPSTEETPKNSSNIENGCYW